MLGQDLYIIIARVNGKCCVFPFTVSHIERIFRENTWHATNAKELFTSYCRWHSPPSILQRQKGSLKPPERIHTQMPCPILECLLIGVNIKYFLREISIEARTVSSFSFFCTLEQTKGAFPVCKDFPGIYPYRICLPQEFHS